MMEGVLSDGEQIGLKLIPGYVTQVLHMETLGIGSDSFSVCVCVCLCVFVCLFYLTVC